MKRFVELGQWEQRQYVNAESKSEALDTFMRVKHIPYVSALDYIDIKEV